ncbi:MAG TPA: hypothetical protein IAB59_05390 [Candidatus Onthousia faecipullorum]|uniref:Spore germination protein N-terminal domain-containing protein n=1 Tax=Candidatus Onthousia faecipullorum TaxID=2840887 RepID=A0A9D1GCS6_9FIRM|nr:hypothetical protein [Candidatus Onthousia faecipullorum]
MKKIIICLIVLLLFLGYTPYNELNSLAVVDTLGLDFTDNKYTLYLNVINDDNKVYTITGNSLGEVFLKARNIDNKKTYYKHLEVVIFNTNILNNTTLNFFKDEFTSIDYLVLATEDKVNDLFQLYHKRRDYKSFIKKEKEMSGSIINTTFKDLLSSSLDDVKDGFIPLISYKENLISKGIFIPSKNISLNEEIARASFLLNDKIDSFNTKIKLNNKSYEASLYNLKTNTKYKDNTINIKITGNIDSPDSNDLTELKKESIKMLENDIEELLNSEKDNKYNISNTINHIYLQTRKLDYDTYKNTKLSIDINLLEKEKNNYD